MLDSPAEYESWSAEDQAILDHLIEKMDAHFKNKENDELNIDINTGSRIDVRIWDRFVQEANDAGWIATRRGAQVRVKRPSRSGFTTGTVERG